MHLEREQALRGESILSSAVGEAAVLRLHHREATRHQQAAVEELKAGAGAAGVHAYVIQDVTEERRQNVSQLGRRPLIKHFLQAQDVHVGWKQSRHLQRRG